MYKVPSVLLFAAVLTGQAHAQPSITWVKLPGGCFTMGETRVYREETPRREACVKPFSISAHEITNGQFRAFVKQTGYVTRAERGWKADEPGSPGADVPPASAVFVPPDGIARALNWWRLVDGANWRKPAGPESGAAANDDLPVVHVTRSDAEAFAEWAGGRLPTESEWEYAARGGLKGQLYSWDEAEEIALEKRANTWQGIFPVMNSGADGFKGLAPVGSFPPNGFGLFDMVGNAWEWTSSVYYPTHMPPRPMLEKAKAGYDPTQPGIAVGVIKGGSYLCARSYCFRFRPAARQAQDLAFGTSHVSFRIVRSTPPADE